MTHDQNPSEATNFATAKDVAAALAAIGLRVPERQAIAAISAACRAEFLGALRACVMQRDEDGTARNFLENITECVAPDVQETLQGLGLSMSYEDLIAVAFFRPARFRSAIVAASNPQHAKHRDAIAFLNQFVRDKAWQQEEAKEDVTPPLQSQIEEPELPSVYDLPGLPPDPYAGEPEQPKAPPPAREPMMRRPKPQAEHSTKPPAARPNPLPRPAGQEAAPPQKTVTKPAAPAPEEPSENYRSHHVYGADFALCFNASTSPDGTPSVMIDAAVINGPRNSDWRNAIHIMLDVREVACVLAVFRRWRNQVEFTAHGKRNDKSFSLAWQGSHFFCKVAARTEQKPVRAVKILPHDAVKVAVLFLEQLLLAYPNLPANEVLALARSVNTIEDRQVANG